MRQILLALGFVAFFLPGSAQAGERAGFTVDKFGQTVTHACTDGEGVVVNGASNTVTLTGECGGVTVNGAQNRVTIASVADLTVNGSTNTVDADAVDRISVSGTKNKITWKKAIDEDKKAPSVKKSGKSNSVEQKTE